MQEIVAIVRANMVGPTKLALTKAGCPSFSCAKCLGRGKKGMDNATLRMVMENGELPRTPTGESLTEVGRLIPKRLFNICVPDDKADAVIRAIIEANSTAHPGDGKIFVMPPVIYADTKPAEADVPFKPCLVAVKGGALYLYE